MTAPLTHGGAVVYRETAAGPEFLLVEASRSKDWVFPKGHVDPGETPSQAAVRETREEAGIDGTLGPSLGTQEFEAGGERVRVAWWLLRAEREVPPTESRRKQWLRLDDALPVLRFATQRDLLRLAHRTLAGAPTR